MLTGRAGDLIAIPLPNNWIDGRRMRAALKARHSGKGYAVEFRANGGCS
jgi:hypothetical protein